MLIFASCLLLFAVFFLSSFFFFFLIHFVSYSLFALRLLLSPSIVLKRAKKKTASREWKWASKRWKETIQRTLAYTHTHRLNMIIEREMFFFFILFCRFTRFRSVSFHSAILMLCFNLFICICIFYYFYFLFGMWYMHIKVVVQFIRIVRKVTVPSLPKWIEICILFRYIIIRSGILVDLSQNIFEWTRLDHPNAHSHARHYAMWCKRNCSIVSLYIQYYYLAYECVSLVSVACLFLLFASTSIAYWNFVSIFFSFSLPRSGVWLSFVPIKNDSNINKQLLSLWIREGGKTIEDFEADFAIRCVFNSSSNDRWWSIITRVGDITKWTTSRERNENCFLFLLEDWIWNQNLPFCTSFRHLLRLRGGHLHRFALLEPREAILVHIAMRCDSMLPPFLFHNSILANEKYVFFIPYSTIDQ